MTKNHVVNAFRCNAGLQDGDDNRITVDGVIFAYICPACDNTHLMIDLAEGNAVMVNISTETAEDLAKQLINPQTLG